MNNRIVERLATLGDNPGYAEFRTSGLLFHGTCEPIEGRLHTGGYDDLFWTGETPAIAEAYIPASGMSMLLTKPNDYHMQERIKPDKHGVWSEIMRQMGHWPREVKHDAFGRADSWTIDSDHPTYADAAAFVRGLGYTMERNEYAPIRMVGDQTILLPADYMMPGEVYVTLKDDLNILDLRDQLQSDLLDPGHRQFRAFEQAQAEGYDGIMIDDYAQCGRNSTNVGHPSVGLFSKTLKRLEFSVYSAIHCDMTRHPFHTTPAFLDFRTAGAIGKRRRALQYGMGPGLHRR